jgi:SPP1 gp7 family putative phage head morphogenesis protein
MNLSKFKIARAVHANRGIAARYRRQLMSLIDEMSASVEYWLPVQYKKAPPRLAMDATPSDQMKSNLRKIAKRWRDRFDETAPRIAEAYLQGMFKATDSAMRSALRDSGWTVKFKMTPAMRDAFDASLSENVALIKSIPEQYFLDVEGAVSRSYAAGRDLETMVKSLKKIYPKAANRAVLIARDQSNKANATVTHARYQELGIEEAIWMHSHGGRVPRPDHVAADGRKYKVAEGCLISGEYIRPGELINCRCTSRPVLPIPTR